MSEPMKIESNPEEEARLLFLAERKTGIGGSDAAVILGISKWQTPLGLAQVKLGQVESFSGNRFTDWGNRLEDVVSEWYAENQNCTVRRDRATYRLKEYPFIMAHIDRRIQAERKFLECKTGDKWTTGQWGETGSQDFPDTYLCQVQHYLMFPYWDEADLAVLIGGNDIRLYPGIEPDTELQGMMLEAEIAFWDTISRGDMPAPINTDDTRNLWGSDNSNIIFATAEVQEWNEELKKSMVSKKELEAKIDDLKTKMQSFMQENSVLNDEHGNKLRQWKSQKTAKFNITDFKANEYDLFNEYQINTLDKKSLKKDHKSIYEKYQITGRVFR